MGRKLRLCYKKNQERKKYCVTTLPVSIPLRDVSVFPVSIPLSALQGNGTQNDSPSKLTVSLPREYFVAVPASTLSVLHTRLAVLQSLPTGWMDASVGTEEVTLCQISNYSAALTPVIRFTLKIAIDFTWTLFFFDQRIETGRCPTLASKQPLLRSPANVADLTATIDGSCLCVGNPDDRFRPLLARRQGVFTDQHGKKLCVPFWIYILDICRCVNAPASLPYVIIESN